MAAASLRGIKLSITQEIVKYVYTIFWEIFALLFHENGDFNNFVKKFSQIIHVVIIKAWHGNILQKFISQLSEIHKICENKAM